MYILISQSVAKQYILNALLHQHKVLRRTELAETVCGYWRYMLQTDC